MPLRNLLIVAIAIVASLACYSVAARNRYANMFAEAINVVESRALQSMTRQELFDSAMTGMLTKLDRHSRYLSGDVLKGFRADIDQQFGGLGIFIHHDTENKQLIVRAPFPGSPGMKAGLVAGDKILKIDGADLAEMKNGDAIKRIKGEVGTPVTLTIERETGPEEQSTTETLDVTVVREIIDVPSVRGDLWNADGSWNFTLGDYPRLGYIRLESFGKETTAEFQAAIKQLPADANGLVIDLRGNSGGLLDSVVEICDMLLPPDKPIVSIKSRQRKMIEKVYESKSAPQLDQQLPIVVLIDRQSASASEIMAGCLQDHGRAVLIGEQSWGKGTVQDVLPIERGESALKLTTASYWRPSGKNIDRDFAKANNETAWGVQPDDGFLVELAPEQVAVNLFLRGEHELRELTGGKSWPMPDFAGVFADEDSPADTESSAEAPKLHSPTEDPVEPAAIETVDQPLERAIEYLRSLKTPATKAA